MGSDSQPRWIDDDEHEKCAAVYPDMSVPSKAIPDISPVIPNVKATGVVTETAWAGAAYNLMLFILASHVSLRIN